MPPASVLFVCTGNLCRSPSAAGLLAQRLYRDGPGDVTVGSRGTMQAGGRPPEPLLVAAEAEPYRLDLRDHRPRRLAAGDVNQAGLILGMAAQHVRETVLIDQAAFSRTFTLREFVRRATGVGQRPADVTLGVWLSAVTGDRRHLDLVGSSTDDDIADPMGGPPQGYRVMLDQVRSLTDSLYELVWGAPDQG